MTVRGPGGAGRRGRVLAVAMLLLGVSAIAVIVAVNSGASAPRSGAGTTATGAATVERRDLVATDTESGMLSYDDPQTVYNRMTGTITWVPKVGAVIKPGQTLFTVDNRPVLLMSGSTPAYRDLTSTDKTGPDVYELNRSLVNLGYNPDGIVIDDTWQPATTAGVDELQAHLGESETGTLTLGQVVFLPGPQMIQTVDTTVGSTGGGGSGASYHPAAPSTEFVDYSSTSTTATATDTTTSAATTQADSATTTTNATPASTTTITSTTRTPRKPPATKGDSTLHTLIQTLRQQTAALKAAIRAASRQPAAGAHGPSSTTTTSSKPKSTSNGKTPAKSSSSKTPTSGSGGGSAVAVLGTSSTRLVVTVDLDASRQSEATLGEKVTVEMPSGGTQTGHVTAVSPVAQSSGSDSSADGGGGSSGSGSSTVPVTIVLDRPARGGGLDQASVSVNFVQSKARNVLSVPVTALLATSGSSFALQEADAPHRLIPIRTGLFAAGYVAISGAGVHPGLRVTDSQG